MTKEEKIERLRKRVKDLEEINSLRKYQLSQFHNLMDTLIQDGKITKDEIHKFIVKKRIVKLNNNDTLSRKKTQK